MPALRPPLLSQSGLAGAPAIAALLAVLLLSLLALDVLTLYSLRVRLHHALLHAARQASIHQGSPEHIARSFSQGLAAARAPRRDRWQIRILSPSAAAFALHGRPSRQHAMRPVIRQGWQARQHAHRPDSRPTIFQANTLHLQLRYAHQPGPLSLSRLLPILAASLNTTVGPRALLMRLDIRHPMQSDAVQWDDLADGRVVYGADHAADLPAPGAGSPAPGRPHGPPSPAPPLPPFPGPGEPSTPGLPQSPPATSGEANQPPADPPLPESCD